MASRPGAFRSSLAPALRVVLLAAGASLAVARADAQAIAPVISAAGPAAPAAAAPEKVIDITSDRLDYLRDPDRVTAIGRVRMAHDDYRLRADTVTWNRSDGSIIANGNVAIKDADGNTLYATQATVDEGMNNGVVADPLMVLEGTGRLAGQSARRQGAITVVDHAAYSACPVIDDDGCPEDPFWTITARQITHNEETHRISYKDARLNALGVPLLWLPWLSHSDGSGTGGSSGLLVPDLRYTATKGFEYAQPYYLRFRPDQDLTITPHFYSGALPMVAAEYRQLVPGGAFRVLGWGTYGSRFPADIISPRPDDGRKTVRGAIQLVGGVQLDPFWSIRGSIRAATDRSFLRRYEINGDDRLRSIVTAERIDDNSYLSIAGEGFQILRFSGRPEEQAYVLPQVSYRKRLDDPLLGGTVDLQADALSIFRGEGQDMQRLVAGAEWNKHLIDEGGRLWTFTGLARTDGYRVTRSADTPVDDYRGTRGLGGRAIAATAIDLQWPLIAPLGDGTQTLIPRLQLASSVLRESADLPNEDARAFDLDEMSIFTLDPLPGYDRWADGSRLAYGFEWRYDRPGWSLRSTIGQALNIARPQSDLPAATGLEGRTTDIVTGSSLRIGKMWRLSTHVRLDDNTLVFRRLDADATWSGKPGFVTVSYTRLNRDAVTPNGDLPDHEELRLGFRAKLARYWSLTANTIVDLTGRNEDPLSTGDGFQLVRRRIGLDYDDECISVGINYRRQYDATGNASGDSFGVHFSIKTLGR